MSARAPRGPWGFAAGFSIGAVLTTAALAGGNRPVDAGDWLPAGDLWSWVSMNLGNALWLFLVIFLLYVLNLQRLHRLLDGDAEQRAVVELDQLSDVWIHLFVGVGVIWTAVGMRSALQAALGDPGVVFNDSAGNVLRKLVDGGILLALSTTIVGGIGGYLMRLGKTMLVGARLQERLEADQRQEMQALIAAAERIEARLQGRSASSAQDHEAGLNAT